MEIRTRVTAIVAGTMVRLSERGSKACFCCAFGRRCNIAQSYSFALIQPRRALRACTKPRSNIGGSGGVRGAFHPTVLGAFSACVVLSPGSYLAACHLSLRAGGL